jgi:hypothetical protein
MSSHPESGNRTQYITKEAESLTIASPADSQRFAAIKTAFASLPPAKSMAELEQAARAGGDGAGIGRHAGQPVPRPAPVPDMSAAARCFRRRAVELDRCLEQRDQGRPQNGYGQLNGQTSSATASSSASRRPNRATCRQRRTLAEGGGAEQSRPRMAGAQQSIKISQRSALATRSSIRRRSAATSGSASTRRSSPDGSLFYYLTIVPEKDAAAFQEVFRVWASQSVSPKVR